MKRVPVPPRTVRSIRRGRVWLGRREIPRYPPDLVAGDVVILEDARSREFVAMAFFNPHSRIVWRVLSTEPVEPGIQFFKERLASAWERRMSWLKTEWPDTDAFRWVHGESDGLPGVVIDVYNGYAIVQILSLGMERLADQLWEALKAFDLRGVAEKSTGMARHHEKLPDRQGVIWGKFPDRLVAREEGEPITVPWLNGHKTGVYLDQKENRAWLKRHAEGRRILDLCCYKGDFALIAARRGAEKVVAVERALRMLEWAEEDLRREGFEQRVELIHGDVFGYLRHLAKQNVKFDIIILDPPPLARSALHLQSAVRAYRELNRQALRLLSEDGYLLTCSCSHPLDQERFIQIVRQASASLPRKIQIVRYRKAPDDHPFLPHQIETDYFQTALVRPLE